MRPHAFHAEAFTDTSNPTDASRNIGKLSSDIGTIGVGHSLRPRTVQPLHATSSEANRFRSEACSFRGLSGSRRGRR
ncbi:hypothetical protein FMEAI12_3640007 [Parafrankia sp. Ea1.12]|nr:hypothetical protein FMEAI12_3640007 [Parafrankia sp. Ea1.12]